MKKTLELVLLIDDNEADNYFHEEVIKDAEFSKRVVIRDSGVEALKYLTTEVDGKFPKPDLIFLDINMPKMNGWEFLERYEKLSELQKSDIILVMLTTSLNPGDRERAEEIDSIHDFINKPLSVELLQKFLEKYVKG